jgi:hypothetical protein
MTKKNKLARQALAQPHLYSQGELAYFQLWLKERNNILHGFAKSKTSEGTKNIVEFHHNAIDAAENGLRLTKLVSKWHKQQLQITNKKK